MAVDFVKENISVPEIVLEVKNLEVDFTGESGKTKAVDNVSFKIRKGETIGIVGESGSGKSVSSLAIMQLIGFPGTIGNGEINFRSRRFGDLDLTKAGEKRMKEIRGNEISMIFQEPMTSLNPVYTCGEQVIETLILHKKISRDEAYRKTIDLFEKVMLPRPKEIFKSYPHQISGGQKQRVMIAMAMSCNPLLLIADEPTTALDVTVQATILDLMKKLKDESDTSIIFITHDLGVIAEVADRVLVMYHGKLVEQGTALNIFSSPKHPYTKGLLACKPRVDFRLRKLPVISDFVELGTEGQLIEKEDSKFNTIGEAFEQNLVQKEETIDRLKKLEVREPVLKVRELKTYFPVSRGWFKKSIEYVKAVDNVSFDVYPGETLGLVGESGCGKTTLGRTILRLIEPTGGDIIFEGKRINDLSSVEMRKMRRDIQIIFQDPYSSLNPRLTVGEAIMEPMRVHGIAGSDNERRNKVIDLLETVNLKKQHFNRYPHEFSGGQRQRICIARALALNPKFIICDESVSALDVSVQAQVLNLLNELKSQFGFTYIFISHDLSVVKFMSDRIVVMNKGKIEEMGPADEIYENPQTSYTQKLINAIPRGEVGNLKFRKIKK